MNRPDDMVILIGEQLATKDPVRRAAWMDRLEVKIEELKADGHVSYKQIVNALHEAGAEV